MKKMIFIECIKNNSNNLNKYEQAKVYYSDGSIENIEGNNNILLIISFFAKQENCTLNELLGDSNKIKEKITNNKRKYVIRITSITAAFIIAILGINTLFNNKKKNVKNIDTTRYFVLNKDKAKKFNGYDGKLENVTTDEMIGDFGYPTIDEDYTDDYEFKNEVMFAALRLYNEDYLGLEDIESTDYFSAAQYFDELILDIDKCCEKNMDIIRRQYNNINNSEQTMVASKKVILKLQNMFKANTKEYFIVKKFCSLRNNYVDSCFETIISDSHDEVSYNQSKLYDLFVNSFIDFVFNKNSIMFNDNDLYYDDLEPLSRYVIMSLGKSMIKVLQPNNCLINNQKYSYNDLISRIYDMLEKAKIDAKNSKKLIKDVDELEKYYVLRGIKSV